MKSSFPDFSSTSAKTATKMEMLMTYYIPFWDFFLDPSGWKSALITFCVPHEMIKTGHLELSFAAC